MIAIELDQMFSDELAEDVRVRRGNDDDVIRAIVIPAGQEVISPEGISLGKRAVDLLVLKSGYVIAKNLEQPQQNDVFTLSSGASLKLLVGPSGTFEWEVLDHVYRITATIQ